MAAKSRGRKIYRDAKTGQFVTKKYVEKHPATTVTETVGEERAAKKKARPSSRTMSTGKKKR